VCVSATKCGKTMACAWWLAHQVANTPGGMFWWVGPTNDVGLIGYKSVIHLLGPVVRKTNDRPFKARCWNGAIVLLKTAQEPEFLRGAGVSAMVLDEAGTPVFDAAWPEIRTTISATKGRLKIIGNPGDIGGFMHKAVQWSRDSSRASWSYHGWKFLDRPTATAEEMEEAAIDFGGVESDDYRRYYLGEFIEGGGSFFYNISDVCVSDPQQPVVGEKYVIGVDPCIRSDYFVASVFKHRTREQVWLSRHKGSPTEHQEAEVARLARHYNNATVLVEVNGPGGPIWSRLVGRGVNAYPHETSARSKPEMLYEYRSDISYALLKLLKHEEQEREHIAYQARRAPTGTTKFGAPSGGHDDTVIANALAAKLLRQQITAEMVWVA